MKKSGFIFTILAVGIWPIWCGQAAPSMIVYNSSKATELTVQEAIQEALGPVVLALNESIIEERATSAELEERVERLEELVMDIAPVYSWALNDAVFVKRTGGYNDGVAYDSIAHMLYWSSNDTKSTEEGPDDAEVQAVFNTFRYGPIRGLAHDWITGNLYGVSNTGIVFVCNTTLVERLDCEVLLSGRGNLISITLNPIDGLMYWTENVGNTIQRAEMDGTGPSVLVSGLGDPHGKTIDFDTSRLYCVEAGSQNIQSSDLQGKDVRTIVTLPSHIPVGIAILSGRVYWGNGGPQSLQSITRAGEDIRTLYDGKNGVRQLALATSELPRNRTDHCDYYSCIVASAYAFSRRLMSAVWTKILCLFPDRL